MELVALWRKAAPEVKGALGAVAIYSLLDWLDQRGVENPATLIGMR